MLLGSRAASRSSTWATENRSRAGRGIVPPAYTRRSSQSFPRRALPATRNNTWPREFTLQTKENLLFLQFQFAGGFIFFEEFAELGRGFEQANPLFVIERDGKAAEA